MHDPYLSDEQCVKRLVQDYKVHNSIVIAYDFDDTVYDFHKKGSVYPKVIDLLRKAKKAGCYLIVWTGNQDTEFIREYLAKNDIPYDAINENAPFDRSTSRKVYANLYLDDRAGLSASCSHLSQLLSIIQSKSNP